jgi:pimeloyl-ACP methyl ester carboxylesterase
MPTAMRSLLTIFLLCLFSLTARSPIRAQEPNPAAPLETDKEKVMEYTRLTQELNPLFAEKRFEEAADVCHKLIELLPRRAEPHYNLACAHARLGRKDQALSELEKAVELGFEDAAHIEKDDDLVTLRTEARYGGLVARARATSEGRIEQGEEIAGVKTVEGAPEGGLRFRVRMSPDATRDQPQRLILWMHPSGSSMDDQVEKLAPRFGRHGFALVVFTTKNYAGWSGADVARLPKTLDALTGIEGLSDDRPILMGLSAGGQMALVLWKRSGAGLGGLILGAAYPVLPGPDGEFGRMELPDSLAARKVPLFVLIGSKDAGSSVWKQMESTFKGGGTPVTLTVVQGKGHEWLFAENELQALDLWLQERTRTGARPGATGWRPKLGE